MTRVSWILGAAVAALATASVMGWFVRGGALRAPGTAEDLASRKRLEAMQGQISKLSRQVGAMRSLVNAKNTQPTPAPAEGARGAEPEGARHREGESPESPEAARARAEAGRAEQERMVSDGHASEARDVGWSRSFEPQLRKALIDTLAAGGELVEIDCAAISCRAKLLFGNEELRRGALTRVRDLPEFASETFYFYQEEAGKFAATLFTAREGHSLVAQYLPSRN